MIKPTNPGTVLCVDNSTHRTVSWVFVGGNGLIIHQTSGNGKGFALFYTAG